MPSKIPKKTKGKESKKYAGLNDLFILKMNALYDIENQLTDALDLMTEAASDPDLKDAFEDHISETSMHAQRIEDIFSMLDMKPKSEKVEGVRGLIKDAEWLIKNTDSDEARDAVLIAAALEAEHYEMAAYDTAVVWASLLGYVEAQSLLEETLAEEKKSADKLSEIGSHKVFAGAVLALEG